MLLHGRIELFTANKMVGYFNKYSTVEGNKVIFDDQEADLSSVVETVEEIWGSE